MSDSTSETTAPKPFWFMVVGFVLIIAGFACIVFPLASTLAIKIVIGWALLFVGVSYLVSAFSSEKKSGRVMNIILGILFIIVGGWMAFNLFEGVIGLTIMLALAFIFQGFVEVSESWKRRPGVGWGWLMVSGIISILAGMMIYMSLPSSAVWALGLMVGINLISSGAYFLAMGGVIRQLTK
ncbi:MAG: HdeD family acid-resistance protein [Paracoccaceae bacterium]